MFQVFHFPIYILPLPQDTTRATRDYVHVESLLEVRLLYHHPSDLWPHVMNLGDQLVYHCTSIVLYQIMYIYIYIYMCIYIYSCWPAIKYNRVCLHCMYKQMLKGLSKGRHLKGGDIVREESEGRREESLIKCSAWATRTLQTVAKPCTICF